MKVSSSRDYGAKVFVDPNMDDDIVEVVTTEMEEKKVR